MDWMLLLASRAWSFEQRRLGRTSIIWFASASSPSSTEAPGGFWLTYWRLPGAGRSSAAPCASR